MADSVGEQKQGSGVRSGKGLTFDPSSWMPNPCVRLMPSGPTGVRCLPRVCDRYQRVRAPVKLCGYVGARELLHSACVCACVCV